MSGAVEDNNFLDRTNLQIERLERVKRLICLACLRIKMRGQPNVSEVRNLVQYCRGFIKLIGVEPNLKSIYVVRASYFSAARSGPIAAVVRIITREAGSAGGGIGCVR